MLGFGISFIYETLILSKDFYQATDELTPRVLRTTIRASVLGLAVALTLCGGSIVIPNRLRHGWLV